MRRRPSSFRRALTPPANADDLSGPAHRQAIGWLGALLPATIVVLDRVRPTAGLTAEELTSMSAYHYSSGVIAFAGVLSAMAVYLITYEGYDTADGTRDRVASSIAGWAAAFVVIFPTRPPGDTTLPMWWRDWIGWAHYGAAGVLFASFIYFCVFRFTKSADPPDGWGVAKRIKKGTYVACGIGIAGALAWAVVAGRRGDPIFWQEFVAVELFAVSWLLKGDALTTARRVPGALKSMVDSRPEHGGG